MKKIIAFIAAGMLLVSAAGCSGGEAVVTTAAVTGVAGSDDVIDYIGRSIPHFAEYVRERRVMPITFETTLNSDQGVYKTAFYIKDETTFAHTSISPDGTETRAVFKNDKRYDIFGDEKKIYYTRCDGNEREKVLKAFVMEIDSDEMAQCKFSADEQALDGVTYFHEQIISPIKDENGDNTGELSTADYYFDKETGKLRFIVSGSVKTEVTVFEHTVDDVQFDLPNGYQMTDYQEYYDSYLKKDKT